MENSWQILLDILVQQSQNRLQNIKNTDPISFCLDDENVRAILTKYMDDYLQFQAEKEKVKSVELSEQIRKRGNEEFKCKNLKKSLDLYTESIFYAPKGQECLALAFANRSLVLYHLNEYRECCQDIRLALSHGYPVSSSAKLFLRMAKCLAALGEIKAAETLFKETLENMQDKCQDDLEFYKKQFSKLVVNISGMENIGSNELFMLPEPEDGKNASFASASNCLTVVYSKGKGRHVRACKDIKMGDVLFVEKPFALVTLKEACDNCCAEVIAPIPCWNCLKAKYCSERCRDKFWEQFHKYECGFGQLLKSVGIAHLALRVALVAAPTFNQFKKILKKVKTKQIMVQEESTVELKDLGYENVFNLVTNMSSLEAQDLYQYALTACLLSLYMQQHTNYFSGNDEKNLKQFASIVLKHICQLVCNGHAITSVRNINEDVSDLVTSQMEERIGTAIYPSASMMNHSCDPSIINSFHKDILIVRASKNIIKGEEIFNCYGPHCRRMARAERQQVLYSQYRFRCNCSACTSAIDIRDIYMALRCPKCKGPSVQLSLEASEILKTLQKEVKSAGDDSEKHLQSSICMTCGYYCTISKELARKQTQIENLLSEGQRLLWEDENVSLALDKLLASWKLGRLILYKFHKNLNAAADLVAKCLLLLGEYRRCVMFLKCTVLSVKAQFGATSIELATELKKLADCMRLYVTSNKFKDSNCDEDSRSVVKAAAATYEKAGKIYLLLCGSNHPCSVEIQASITFLKSYKF